MFTKRVIPCLDVNGGRVVKGVGIGPLLQAALVHHADLVAHGKGFLLVVGNQ